MKNSPIPGVVKKVLPSVVSVIVSKLLPVFETPYGLMPQQEENPFGAPLPFPFMVPKGKKKIQIGGGSGFIVESSGIIITNRHVVADSLAEYTVVLNEEKKYSAEVVARDPINDVAILKIKEKNLPALALGDSSKLELGQTAIAIGNALGNFLNTVSVGVVSGLSREISAGDVITKRMTKLRGLIQTDAAINPGNSGGPLIDIEGRVIGINTAMVFMAENIGFALPINNAKKDLQDLKKFGRIRHPFLGLRYVILDKELQEKFKLSVDRGALVISEPAPGGQAVVPGGAADRAGIKEGDVILEIANQQISTKNPLEEILQKQKIGDSVSCKVIRKGQELTLKAILTERK
ncbi:MAG: trypsin-like peptidase domain-containing protein [Candidatus Nealsonbacteria bacterium]|nr:trypsin-like peptidase domain-containing protein [Candidatus Nealsonbacteria bacterium]